jgi:hypothetical protein
MLLLGIYYTCKRKQNRINHLQKSTLYFRAQVFIPKTIINLKHRSKFGLIVKKC